MPTATSTINSPKFHSKFHYLKSYDNIVKHQHYFQFKLVGFSRFLKTIKPDPYELSVYLSVHHGISRQL
jgi:hypothetical protein